MLSKRFELIFKLGRYIRNTDDIISRSVEFSGRFEPFLLCFRNADGFLENRSSVLGFGRKNFGNLSLPDNGVTFFGNTPFAEIIDDIFKSREFSVDVVFAFARSVQFSGEHDFAIFEIFKHMVCVIEDERNFAVRQRFSVLRTVEDNVLHVGAAELFCRLFP